MFFEIIKLIHTPISLFAFLLLFVLPLFFSIAFHELAHGYVAYKFGDITPKLLGRLTLNPFKHLDPLGTIFLFFIGIGWAKPIIINPLNLKTQTEQMLVALAGPVSNFVLAFIFAILISVLENLCNLPFDYTIIIFLKIVVAINLALCIFNLIPIPPLDGSRIVAWLLPEKLKILYNKFENYGIFIMLLILITVGFGIIFNIANYIENLIFILLKVS